MSGWVSEIPLIIELDKGQWFPLCDALSCVNPLTQREYTRYDDIATGIKEFWTKGTF